MAKKKTYDVQRPAERVFGDVLARPNVDDALAVVFRLYDTGTRSPARWRAYQVARAAINVLGGVASKEDASVVLRLANLLEDGTPSTDEGAQIRWIAARVVDAAQDGSGNGGLELLLHLRWRYGEKVDVLDVDFLDGLLAKYTATKPKKTQLSDSGIVARILRRASLLGESERRDLAGTVQRVGKRLRGYGTRLVP